MVQKAKVYIYAKLHKGEPKLTDFELKEEELGTLKDGEVLIAAMYFGVNAGLRAYQDMYPLGSIIVGGQVARVIDSRNKKFPLDAIVYALVGWRTHTIVNPEDFPKNNLFVMPDFGGLPYSLGIGYLSMPGNAAYFGLLEICKPKAGETVVVTAAAGSVGSLVGQIAKLKGCKVIGFTGSDEKCRWLEDDLGFDKAINYKVGKLAKALKDAAPDGVDCFFDNVGGELSNTIIHQMNFYGRIACCGAVSEYNSESEPKIRSSHTSFILKQLSMEGFVVYRWADRWMEGIMQIKEMIDEGKVKYRETITEGFENMPQAFIEVLEGKNYGKAVVKV